MKISCPGCEAMFALQDERVPPRGLSIKCPKCKAPFSVRKTGEAGKVVRGVPLASVTGPAARDTVVDQPAIERSPSATVIDVR